MAHEVSLKKERVYFVRDGGKIKRDWVSGNPVVDEKRTVEFPVPMPSHKAVGGKRAPRRARKLPDPTIR